jgi:asparagine synthetase B (glutamine-hydrolysing)
MSCPGRRNEDVYAVELLELLKDSIRIRLRADVPVLLI